MKRIRSFALRETLLLMVFIGIWLAITIQWGALSLPFWALAVGMAAVLRPTHQRRSIPDSVTDVLSVAVSWAVAGGVAGIAFDLRQPSGLASDVLSWAVIGELTGFYLGFLWVMVLLVFQHIERLTGSVNRARRAI